MYCKDETDFLFWWGINPTHVSGSVVTSVMVSTRVSGSVVTSVMV